MSNYLVWTLAFLVGTVAVARATRLVVDDDFPPVVWLREWYVRHTPERWGLLVECPFCVSMYFAIADTAWAFVSDLHWTWWFLNLLLAGAYLAAMICVRDLPEDQRAK